MLRPLPLRDLIETDVAGVNARTHGPTPGKSGTIRTIGTERKGASRVNERFRLLSQPSQAIGQFNSKIIPMTIPASAAAI